MKTFLTIVRWFLIGIAVIQFIPVDRVNPPVKKSENFVDIFKTPPKVASLIKNACYDCHSNETKYPDYAFVAPISWAVKDHINNGREHLNFSTWATFNPDLKKNMLESAASAVENSSMPLPGYIVYHPKANLTAAQKKILADYFTELLNSGRF